MKSQEKMHYTSFAYQFSSEIAEYAKTLDGMSEFSLAKRTFDWSARRTRSRGGMYRDGPGISIAMARTCASRYDQLFVVKEYPAYESHPTIGSIYTYSILDSLRLTIAHEMAHALQYFSYRYHYRPKSAPHGPVFKEFYTLLREKFVNIHLDDQEQLKREYEQELADCVHISSIQQKVAANFRLA